MDFKDLAGKIEPEANCIVEVDDDGAGVLLTSLAISMKRIADALTASAIAQQELATGSVNFPFTPPWVDDGK